MPDTPRTEPQGPPRLVRAQREGVTRIPCNLDELLPPEHLARDFVAVVEKLDMGPFEASIRARQGEPGRPATDPRVLVALWLFATYEGVAEARELDRRCKRDMAYMWICGGVSVDYHLLSDFRVQHQEALESLMSQVLAVLQHQGLVRLERTAQDGMRVRASAGAASFRREPSLQRCLEEAQQRVQQLRESGLSDPTLSARQMAARQRAAREREDRVRRALEELPKVREAKKPQDKPQARVSTTDPEARVMKMANGGFNPAYNVQLSVDTQTRVIVEADLSNSGSDMGQVEPMLERTQQRHGRLPTEHLVDGGFASKESIEGASGRDVTMYAPVQKPKRQDVNPHEPKPGDSPAVAAWRQRMGTSEAKEIYKQRAATVETANGDLREHRGLQKFVVRGMAKARCVLLWAVIAYNLTRLLALGSIRVIGR